MSRAVKPAFPPLDLYDIFEYHMWTICNTICWHSENYVIIRLKLSPSHLQIWFSFLTLYVVSSGRVIYLFWWTMTLIRTKEWAVHRNKYHDITDGFPTTITGDLSQCYSLICCSVFFYACFSIMYQGVIDLLYFWVCFWNNIW